MVWPETDMWRLTVPFWPITTGQSAAPSPIGLSMARLSLRAHCCCSDRPFQPVRVPARPSCDDLLQNKAVSRDQLYYDT